MTYTVELIRVVHENGRSLIVDKAEIDISQDEAAAKHVFEVLKEAIRESDEDVKRSAGLICPRCSSQLLVALWFGWMHCQICKFNWKRRT